MVPLVRQRRYYFTSDGSTRKSVDVPEFQRRENVNILERNNLRLGILETHTYF